MRLLTGPDLRLSSSCILGGMSDTSGAIPCASKKKLSFRTDASETDSSHYQEMFTRIPAFQRVICLTLVRNILLFASEFRTRQAVWVSAQKNDR